MKGRPFKRSQETFKSMTPPPSYATLFNQSRKNNIWTTHNLPEDEGIKRYVNGRTYKVIKTLNGEERLIPMRTPSAALFQYSYTN